MCNAGGVADREDQSAKHSLKKRKCKPAVTQFILNTVWHEILREFVFANWRFFVFCGN